jgi:hypothetical protein
LEQTPFLERRQQGLAQEMVNPAGDEARAELAQDRIIEAGVGQFKPEGILPINPTAHGIGRLAVGQPFGTRQHQHLRQSRAGASAGCAV